MSPLLIVLRLLHIVSACVWVGFAVFTAFFLGPAIQDAGPGATVIMPALARRRLMTILPALALTTILSGLWLYWHLSGAALGTYLQTATGATLAVGAGCAIVAYGLGILITRPSMLRAAALAQNLESASAEERTRRLGEAARLRSRGTQSGRYVAVLVLLAAATMAIARYL